MSWHDLLDFLLALLSVSAMICAVHYVTLATIYPLSFCRFWTNLHGGGQLVQVGWALSARGRVYVAFVYVGAAALSYFAFYGILFWVPESWSWSDNSRENNSVRVYLAAAGAFFSWNVVVALEKMAYFYKAKENLESEVKLLKYNQKS